MTFPRLAVLLSSLSLLACGVDQATLDDGQDGADAVESELSATHGGHFQTFTGQDGQIYFHLLAGNGERVLASQGYSALAGAQSAIASVQANGTNAANYLLRQSSDGASYFVLIASNGAIIATSEMYSTPSNAQRAITAVIKVVQGATDQGQAPQSASHVEVFKGIDGKYYFHLKAGNGAIVLQSQGYSAKSSANNGVASVLNNGTNPSRYHVLTAADGRFYFVLKAANGQIIGRGQTYTTQTSAQDGVKVCMTIVAP